MRRKDRQISEAEALSLLEQGEYGVLGTVSTDGQPYGVPVNYCCLNGSIFFHCALEGRKLDNIRNNPRVSFCVVGNTEVLPAEFGARYESCIVQGMASESLAEEKRAALEGLIAKYSRDFFAEGHQYIEKLNAKTRVFKISVEAITGKARK